MEKPKLVYAIVDQYGNTQITFPDTPEGKELALKSLEIFNEEYEFFVMKEEIEKENK